MIIKNIDQVKEFAAIAENVSFPSLSPYLLIEQNKLKHEWLGAALLAKLELYALPPAPEPEPDPDAPDEEPEENNEPADEVKAEFLKKARAVVSNFGVLQAVPTFEVQFTESGITRIETDTAKSAFRGQVKRLEDTLLTNGFNALEDLLLFLDEYIEDFPEWTDAPGYLEWNKYFFRSAREMNTFYPLKYGRVTFQKLTTHMQHIEDFFLESELGVNQTIALKVLSRSTEELEPIEEKVVHNLKRCVVHLALAKAVIEGYIDITPNGAVFVVPSADNTEGNNTTPAELVNPKALQLERVGMDYWGKTIKLMKANEDEFPSYHQYMKEIKEANKLKPMSGGLYMP